MLAALGIGFGAGGLAFTQFGPSESGPKPHADAATALEREIATLRAEIARSAEQQRESHAALQADLDLLHAKVARIEERPAPVTAAAVPSPVEAVVDAEARAEEALAEASEPPDPEERRRAQLEVLVAAGFREKDVRAYHERIDAIELDRLYLRDLAAREGWLETDRFREESEAIRDSRRAVRDEFGDEFYDWMLFSSEHPNRVRVTDVIGGSVASEAGLLPGDTVLRYGDERVFSPRELRRVTTGGEYGDEVTLEVLRDGQTVRVDVPRGPLGVRIEYATEEPAPRR